MDTGTIKRLSLSSRTSSESRNDMFRSAAKSGDIETFENLLHNQEVDVYVNDCIRKTVLMLVAENGHVECLKRLVDANKIENINQRDEEDKRTALMLAAKNGHTECVRCLIDTRQADVNLCDIVQWTALSFAAMEGHIECIRCLIETELADINICDYKGETAFMLVARYGHAECLKYFVDANKIENIDQCSNTQATALMLAASNGKTECVRILIETGRADVYHCDIQGFTALIFIAMEERFECFQYLVDANKIENINHRANNQQTALMFATNYELIDCVKCLVDIGKADVNLCDSKGQTVLMYAAQRGDYECVRYFIDTGMANVNIRDWKGYTALMQAAQRGYYECVRCLIMTEGIDINLKDTLGRTALMLAADVIIPEYVIYRSRREHEQTECVRLLLSNEMLDLNARDQEGYSALMLASMRNCNRYVELLLNHDKVDVNIRDNKGRTALMLAIWKQSDECIENLIFNKKVNVDECDNEGITAFTLAVRMSNGVFLQCFLEIALTEEVDVIDSDRECDQRKDMFATVFSLSSTDRCVRYFPGMTWKRPYIYGRDQEGKSVLKLVIRNGLPRCVVCFLLAGIDVLLSKNVSCSHSMLEKREPSGFDNNGQTSLITAIQRRDFKSLEYLLQYERIRFHILVIFLREAFFATGTISLLFYKKLFTLIRSLKEVDQFMLMLCSDAKVGVCVDYLLSAFICQIDSSNQSAISRAIHLEDPNYLKILLEHVSDNKILFDHIETACKDFPTKTLNFHPLLELLKLDMFLWKWYPQCTRRNIKALTRELLIRDFVPGCFEWQGKQSSPIHFAFMSGNEGLVRYLVANFYLTSLDLEHVLRDPEICEHLQQRGSEDLQQLYLELFGTPWRLETQCLLTLCNWLRNNKSQKGVERIQSLLPEIFRSRLSFTNPMRMICQRQWKMINLDFMNHRLSTSLSDWNLDEGKCCKGGCLKSVEDVAISDDDDSDSSDSN